MILAYTPDIVDGLATFDAEETRHTIKVLRKRPGDELHWIDGRGGRYRGHVHETGKRHFTATVAEAHHEPQRRPHRITLAVAPTKNITRYEWLLEKATEIGVDALVPLYCAHSERKRLRPDRLEKIVLSATKQSLKAHLPQLHAPVALDEFLQQLPAPTARTRRLIAHCAPGDKAPVPGNFAADADVLVLIGPEGDFSAEEIALAERCGCAGLHLGPERLRTETAALVALTLVNHALNP